MRNKTVSPHPDFKIKLIKTEDSKKKDEENIFRLPNINQ
jgi:hypothetical protein